VAVLFYEELFERNYGIFSPAEQDRIRNARVVIIGCGGIGGVVAVMLARMGIEHFVLYEYDTYTPTNMNRQIACFTDTMGVNKAAAIKDMLLRINPEAEVTGHEVALKPDEIGTALQLGDVILPASDEWPLSIAILGAAKEQGVPAIMAYPVGALARVSTFLPDSPYAAECLVMPYKTPYDGLKIFMDNPDNRKALQYYCSEGAWTQEWFEDWCESKKPHAQLCTTVWITAALATQEIIKLVSGKWKPVTAPHYWHITPSGARIARFGLARRLLSRQVRRPGGQKILPFLNKRPWLLRLFTRLIS
jgi:molybdopterin/thiamine biosynthesis adenylyltransferase